MGYGALAKNTYLDFLKSLKSLYKYITFCKQKDYDPMMEQLEKYQAYFDIKNKRKKWVDTPVYSQMDQLQMQQIQSIGINDIDDCSLAQLVSHNDFLEVYEKDLKFFQSEEEKEAQKNPQKQYSIQD